MSNTLLEVPANIYMARNVQPTSYYGKCVKGDLISKIHAPLVQAGFYLSYEGVYKRRLISVGVDTPWHHVKHLRSKKCGLDHNIKFDVFGFVPPKCLECWKVVVYPRTIKELFALLEVEKSLDKPSKCGIDLRNYISVLYDGFFYNNSLDEGRARYEEVRQAVSEHISPEVKVILKRGCTEYEMVLGPSVGWTMTKAQHKLNDQIDEFVDQTTPNTSGQPKEAIDQVHTHWIEWAWKHADPTVKEYLGDDLYAPCVHYEEGDINIIKADIMRARAKVKYDIDGEVTDAIHTALRGFDMTKRITMEKVGAAIGFEGINPLYRGEGIEIG